MAESDSKGFWGAVQEAATFPLILLLAGAFAAIWGASNGFKYKEIDLSAAGDAWRIYVMIGGAVAVVLAIALYVTDRSDSRPKPPLLYRLSKKHPYTILKPDDKETMEVKKRGQQFDVVITGKRAPRNAILRIMWVAGAKLYPIGDTGSEEPDAPGFSWRFRVYCPAPETIRDDPDERQFALFYVGKEADPLIQHHELLCRYFAKEGNPNWPELPKRVDIVRCSSLRTLRFRVPAADQPTRAMPRSGTGFNDIASRSGTGFDPTKNRMPGTAEETTGRGNRIPGT